MSSAADGSLPSLNALAADPPAAADPSRVTVSLIAHTNVGKTSLARTLLRQDLGEVRDEAHVTAWAEAHTVVASDSGDLLVLWDTPGLGDSVRLLRRLSRDGTAWGWFLSAVWDRWKDRPFWASQVALRHVRDHTDVVLYLVNASETPEASAHVDAEIQLLNWMDRPVLLLLNQTGVDHDPARDAADLERWQQHLQPASVIKGVLTLDAFARCWIQEAVLWHRVAEVLPPAQRLAMHRLSQAWWQDRLQVLHAALDEIAMSLAEVACLSTALDGRSAGDKAVAGVENALMTQVRQRVAQELETLLALHALPRDPTASTDITLRVEQRLELHKRLDIKKSAAWGGVLTGALTGLKADIASGGLTLGGGLLAGGVIGALGGLGLAKGVNRWRGGGDAWAGLTLEAWQALVEGALLRYLAVAHFGRARGAWQADPVPAHWHPAVREVLMAHRPVLAELWSRRPVRARVTSDTGAAPPEAMQAMAEALVPPLRQSVRTLLLRLYPEAAAQWRP